MFIHLHVVATVREEEVELAMAHPDKDMPWPKGPSIKNNEAQGT